MSTPASIGSATALLRRPRICQTCLKSRPAGRINIARGRSYATSGPSSSSSSSSSNKSRAAFSFIPLSFFILPPILWYLSKDSSASTLNPSVYTDHPVSATRKVSEQHKEVVIPLPATSVAAFASPPTVPDGSGENKAVTVYHVMVKSPDLMIERPYTPVNDVKADGEVKLVVKRVRGGEVGRLIHSLKPESPVGLRGPIPTFALDPSAYDRIIMISSGTGVAPFLQFLSAVPASCSGTKYDLIHASPPSERTDWVVDPVHLPRLQEKHKDNLSIYRYPANTLPVNEVTQAVRSKAGEKVMVLVCLPPAMMRPLCGPLTVTLQQGELTGHLHTLGLRSDQVLKLE